MFYRDLSEYSYRKSKVKNNILNVGWLDEFHDFPKGKLSSNILFELLSLCDTPINQTRGFHNCPFCHKDLDNSIHVLISGQKIYLGSAEIWIKGNKNIIYACPDLIVHYIVEHNYSPPQDFIDAVSDGV